MFTLSREAVLFPLTSVTVLACIVSGVHGIRSVNCGPRGGETKTEVSDVLGYFTNELLFVCIEV